MTKEEQKRWEPYIKRYPELAGVAYEIYMRHKTKDANLATYFAWAAKTERRKEQRYNNGLKKYCVREITKMEAKNGDKDNLLFL